LSLQNNSNILIITEVKRREMQESAEMAAWMLRTSPNLELFNGHHILIAQDRHGIFLVFASCHADYLKYLKGGDITLHAFLTMESYGPLMTVKRNIIEIRMRSDVAAFEIFKVVSVT
jgi:hypothetical protein